MLPLAEPLFLVPTQHTTGHFYTQYFCWLILNTEWETCHIIHGVGVFLRHKQGRFLNTSNLNSVHWCVLLLESDTRLIRDAVCFLLHQSRIPLTWYIYIMNSTVQIAPTAQTDALLLHSDFNTNNIHWFPIRWIFCVDVCTHVLFFTIKML